VRRLHSNAEYGIKKNESRDLDSYNQERRRRRQEAQTNFPFFIPKRPKTKTESESRDLDSYDQERRRRREETQTSSFFKSETWIRPKLSQSLVTSTPTTKMTGILNGIVASQDVKPSP